MEAIHEDASAEPASASSQTAQDYIKQQLELEAEAREVLPYQFDTCTKALGPLRQQVFACMTCTPPPSPDSTSSSFTPAGVCYSCSISCHGEHELVELFTRRNFVCDCGTSRYPPTSPCSLRPDGNGAKGNVHSEEPAAINSYNQNFRNRFCGCSEDYDAHKQQGTMFQCLGLGSVDEGGCGEDWWHPDCLMGLPRDWRKKVVTPDPNATEEGKSKTVEGDDASDAADDEDDNPPGFPAEDDFEHLICYKCVSAFPWIKKYAGSPGFLPALQHDKSRTLPSSVEPKPTATEIKTETETTTAVNDSTENVNANGSLKRKAEEDIEDTTSIKKTKSAEGDAANNDAEPETTATRPCRYRALPAPDTSAPISLFLREDFRNHFCRCPSCFPSLARHAQLLEEESAYSPPVSEGSAHGGDGGGGGGGSLGGSSRSLLDRGEAALSAMDRVRAIEGVMAYNHLRDNLKGFLRPFADSGTPVSAEDIKAHFEKMRGDSDAIRAARAQGDDETDQRREQSGY